VLLRKDSGGGSGQAQRGQTEPGRWTSRCRFQVPLARYLQAWLRDTIDPSTLRPSTKAFLGNSYRPQSQQRKFTGRASPPAARLSLTTNVTAMTTRATACSRSDAHPSCRLRAHRAWRATLERIKAGDTWQDHGLVFTTATGRPIEPSNLNRQFTTLTKRAGIGHERVHNLRHTAATLLQISDVAATASLDMVRDQGPIRDLGFSAVSSAG
jgi:hypothetical protein